MKFLLIETFVVAKLAIDKCDHLLMQVVEDQLQNSRVDANVRDKLAVLRTLMVMELFINQMHRNEQIVPFRIPNNINFIYQ